MQLAKNLIFAVEIYAAVGALVALAFVTVGIGRVVDGARGSSIPFRLLMLPGSVVLWPVVLWRWVRPPGAAPGEGAQE